MTRIRVVNFEFILPENAIAVNTTSRSRNWSQGLSPFFLGPCPLYNGYVSLNVENGWQYSKCYEQYVNENLDPTEAYWEWAKAGWAKKSADRYPMGPYNKPLFSYWDGQKLDYVSTRKKIYLPLYSNAVRETNAFRTLKRTLDKTKDILYLIDFDSHNLEPQISYDHLIDNPHIRIGHGYVLAMMLQGLL